MRRAIPVALLAILLLGGCQPAHSPAEARGLAALRAYGCHTCHVIPGVRGADALVGPSLERMGARLYLAGRRPNTPDNMVRWIRDPASIDPETAMPNVGVSEADARDIAAYKQWTRERSPYTHVWYSAYPDATIQNLQKDLALRDGILDGRRVAGVEALLRLL